MFLVVVGPIITKICIFVAVDHMNSLKFECFLDSINFMYLVELVQIL